MNAITKFTQPVVGLNVPAEVGMALEDVSTPALIIDLDAFERNVERMGDFIKEKGIRHRAHAKTHKSADIALYQIEHGSRRHTSRPVPPARAPRPPICASCRAPGGVCRAPWRSRPSS